MFLKTYDIDQWYRASPISLFFFFGKASHQIWNQLKTLVLSNGALLAWFAASENWLIVGLIGVFWLAVISVIALAKYLRFRFKLSSNSISVREGVINLKHIDLQFDRIRAINFERGLVDRWFGLTGISFDTAGTGTAEATVPAVSFSFAESLRDRINQERQIEIEEKREPELGAENSTHRVDLITSLSLAQIVKIGTCGSEVAIGLVWLFTISTPIAVHAFFNQVSIESIEVVQQVRELLLQIQVALAPSVGETGAIVVMLITALASFCVLAWTFQVIGAYVKWKGFRAYIENGRLKSVAGLVTVREIQLDIPKIQSLTFRQNLRNRWFSCFKIRAEQSASDQEHMLHIPLSDLSTNSALAQSVFQDAVHGLAFDPKSRNFISIASPLFWVAFCRSAAISVIGFVVVTLHFGLAYGLLALAWIVPSGTAAYLRWRKAGYLCNHEAIVYRSGILSYILTSLKYSKLQSVDIKQNIIQKWRQRASLVLRNSTTQVEIPYLEYEMASAFRDYLLYFVESSEEEWR